MMRASQDCKRSSPERVPSRTLRFLDRPEKEELLRSFVDELSPRERLILKRVLAEAGSSDGSS